MLHFKHMLQFFVEIYELFIANVSQKDFHELSNKDKSKKIFKWLIYKQMAQFHLA